jgi:hypothetical protein
MKSDPNKEVFLLFTEDNFELARTDEKDISEADFEKAVSDAASTGARLKLELSTHGNALVLVNDDSTSVGQYTQSGQQKPSRWFRRSKVVVETYARTQWRDFMKAAIDNGLAQYERYSSPDGQSAVLRFKRPSPATIGMPAAPISFSPAFYENMQIAPDFPASTGKNGFVLLVHEPHSDFVGQQALLRGLRALRVANPKSEFQFLVEGAYGDPTRNIDFNGLDKALDDASGGDPAVAEDLVMKLLSAHVINGPMAYRLLDGRSVPVPAYAIDDLTQLKNDKPGAPPAPLETELRASERVLSGLESAVDGLDVDARRKLRSTLAELRAYLYADVTEIEGQTLVDYIDLRASALEAIAKAAKGLTSSASLAKDVRLLNSQAVAYHHQRDTYVAALGRNPTMAQEIAAHVSATSPKVSIGFIGSFHTPGVTAALRAKGIGYVVIEPRIQGFDSSVEQDAFDRMIHVETRKAAVRRILGLNSGPTAPSVTEVKTQIVPFFAKDLRRRKKLPAEEVQNSKAIAAIRTNGGFGSARITVSASELDSAPSQFKGAFGFVEQGKSPRLVLRDSDGEAWKGEGRYEFLANAVTVPAVREGQIERQSSVTFYQSPTSKQVFAAIYDPASNRFYLMSADKALDALDHMGPPTVKKGERVRVHMRLSQLESRRAQEVL